MRRTKETSTGHVGSDQWMPTSLLGIERKSANNSKHQFTNLYRLLNKWNLADSYRYLNKSASSGIDKQTVHEFKRKLAEETQRLETELKTQSYKAGLVKRVYIEKENGKKRPLGLPIVRDKLLQTACTRILTAIYEPKFVEGSFGYRRGKDTHKARSYLSNKLNFGRPGYILTLDIKGFFDHMDHEWLLEMLSHDIQDKAFLRLIKKWLKAGVLLPTGEVEKLHQGSPQGGVISPILGNIYLHYALDLWVDKIVRPRMRGEMIYCRYADDGVISFQYKSDAEKVLKVIEKRLAKFYLEVSEEKTQLIRFSRFTKDRNGSFDFLGFTFRWETSQKGKDIITHKTSSKRERKPKRTLTQWIRENRHNRLRKFFDHLNSKLRGYYNYYGVIGNWESLKRIHKVVKRSIHKWLNRRSQRKSFNWQTLSEAFKRYGLIKPYIKKSSNQLRMDLC